MDIEQLTHLNYRKSMWVSVVLSGLAVCIAAILGRGAINLRGALLRDVPSPATVIAALYDDAILTKKSDIMVQNVNELRKEDSVESEKPIYSFLVELSNGDQYLVKLGWVDGEWTVIESETDRLHGESEMLIDTEVPEAESELSQ
ncbi:MAG: hypothetical protein ABL890_01535 [Candidatus Peribacteraceae bacterium]